MIFADRDISLRCRWSRERLVCCAFVAGATFGCAHKPADTVPATAHHDAIAGAGGRSVAPAPVVPSPEVVFWKGRADLIQAPAPPPPTALALPRVERWRLKNGLDIVAVPRPGLPIVSFSVAIKTGAYDEQNGRTEGVADFAAAMLRKGTQKRSADQIADAIDGVGGSLGADAGMESSVASCSVLAKDAALCLDLLAELLLRPTFPEAEMPEVRDQMLAALAARVDDPHQLAAEHFDNLLFGDEHPDGRVLADEHVRVITRTALLSHWKTFYRPNNALLAVAGDFDVAAMKGALARAFGGWRSAPVPARPVFRIPPATGTRVVLVDKPDLTQATLMFGHRGIAHGDPAWYAVTLMNYVLGGSDFSSRLMTEIRSNRGLTYGIGSSFGATLYEGAFRVSAATRNETAWRALTVAVDEMHKMKAAGPAPDEIAKAKGFYAGSLPFELESAAGIARRIVAAELHGLGLAYVQQLPVRLAAVDQIAAQGAARTWLDPDNLAIVIVGRASAIEPDLRKAGVRWEKVDYRAAITGSARRAASPAPSPSPSPEALPTP